MVTRPESVGDHVPSSISISDSDDAAARRAFHRSEHPRSLSGGKTFYSIENQADGSFRAKNPRTSSQKRRRRQRVSEDSSAAPEISRKTSGSRARGKRSSAASATAKRESTSSASRNQNGHMLAPDESRSDKPPSVLPSVTLTGSNIEAPELNSDRSTAADLTPRPARSPSQKRQGRQRHSRELSESKTALTAAIIHLAHITETTKIASPTAAGSHVPSELVTVAASTEQPSHQVVSAPEAPPRTDGLPDATADMYSTPNTDDGSTAAATPGPSLLLPPPGAATSTPPAIPTGSTGSTLSLGSVMDSIDAILRELATFSEESKASGSNTGHNTAHQQQPPEQQTTTFRGTEAPTDPTDVQRTRSESMRAAMIQPLTEGVSATTVNMIIRDGAAAQLKPPPGTALSSASHEAATPDSTAHVGELNTSAQDHAERPPNRYGDRMLRACELSADLPSAKRREHKTRVCHVANAILICLLNQQYCFITARSRIYSLQKNIGNDQCACATTHETSD